MHVIIVGCHYHFSLLHTSHAISLPLSALFLGTVILYNFNENAFTLFHCFLIVCSLQVLACVHPTLYAAHDHVKPHVHTNEEMAFDYSIF